MRIIRNSTSRWTKLALVSLMLIDTGGCKRQAEQPVAVKLLHYGWLPPFDLPTSEAALSEKFKHQSGIRLEIIRGSPTETIDQLSLIRKLLQDRADGPDVVEADVTWLGTLKGEVLDLTPYFQSEPGLLSPALTSSYIMDGKVVAIPYQNQAGVLEYRVDLLRRYGYDHPPRTWTELEAMALRIQTGERARGKGDFWGYIWPGAAEESLTCNALEWQVDEGGGHIIESNGAISVNNPAAIRAWERARRWIGWISPPRVAAYRELDAWNAFQSGQSAFARVWAAEAGDLSTRERPTLHAVNWWSKSNAGETGFAAMPAGSVARMATLGGAGLFVSKYSKHPQESAALIRFVLGEEGKSFEEQEQHGFSRQSVVYDANPIEKAKIVSSGGDSLRATIAARPTRVSALAYDQVSKAYSTAVNAVLTDQKTASAAAFELEQELVQITGLHPGPPSIE